MITALLIAAAYVLPAIVARKRKIGVGRHFFSRCFCLLFWPCHLSCVPSGRLLPSLRRRMPREATRCMASMAMTLKAPKWTGDG